MNTDQDAQESEEMPVRLEELDGITDERTAESGRDGTSLATGQWPSLGHVSQMGVPEGPPGSRG